MLQPLCFPTISQYLFLGLCVVTFIYSFLSDHSLYLPCFYHYVSAALLSGDQSVSIFGSMCCNSYTMMFSDHFLYVNCFYHHILANLLSDHQSMYISGTMSCYLLYIDSFRPVSPSCYKNASETLLVDIFYMRICIFMCLVIRTSISILLVMLIMFRLLYSPTIIRCLQFGSTCPSWLLCSQRFHRCTLKHS